MDYRVLISILVIVLTFVGYGPYIFDIVKGKTRPHAFTWFAVSLTAFVAYALQVTGGAGVGAWPMLIIAGVCVLVFLLSLWRGTKDIKISDAILLVLSLVALFLWIVVKQPILSVLLITAAEILSFVPTIRKSWKDPYSETLSLYEISMVRHGLSILALEHINILTALYPAAWAVTNVVITVILIMRRRVLGKAG
jgi:hypothetical protein